MTEGSVKDYVHDLRKALRDDPKAPRFIETVHRRGYRYIGPIDIHADTQNASSVDEKRTLPPVIAVLPFENFSADKRWDRLANGLTEDMITEFTRYRDLLVIARNSSFIYKNKTIDVRQIGCELSAHYILEGSIQANEEQVRVTTQLLRTTDGSHIWADRYDRPVADIFTIQDVIVERVTATIGGFYGKISHQERKNIDRTAPANLRAYELYLLALQRTLYIY